MGFDCPVCGEPLFDEEHLANHLAFAAVAGEQRHEAWLDEHAPDWGEQGPDALGPRVVEHAERNDLERPPELQGRPRPGTVGTDAASTADSEVREVLAEARELTRRMDADESAEENT